MDVVSFYPMHIVNRRACPVINEKHQMAFETSDGAVDKH